MDDLLPDWAMSLVGIAFIFVSAGVALLGLLVVRRRVPIATLREQHEVAGVSFAVIGGFYGVLLAFVLVASWERFERARADTETEANAIGDLYRQAAALPAASRDELRATLRAYTDSVINNEWPAMQEHSLALATQKLYYKVWNTIIALDPQSGRDVAVYQNMLQRADDFGEARRYRLLYMETGLPPVIWGFLVVFGTVTVGFTYFFGMPRFLPQAMITTALTATIACTLVIIWEMQTPFSGLVRVPDRAYRVVLEFLHPDATSDSPVRD